ncbi:MAG: hypothetical protein P3T54_05590 [Dehalogenimonas sp.]|uniref:Phosphatidate cytidylyltransferase n=1 Tax=Candidatus Dehalogenimonas loeffleri TaxID=3127115 RepID=A0ABZ2J4S1_9CHLR|nr:hypothetical protein [Dehalogenimonas sp.]
MGKPYKLVFIGIVALSILIFAWLISHIFAIGLLLWFLWIMVSIWSHQTDNKFLQVLPFLYAGTVLLGLVWVYYLYGHPEGVLGIVLLLGIPGMGLLGYAAYNLHKALLPLVFGVMWLGLMWRAIAAGWTGDILIPVLAMGLPGIVLIIYSVHLFARNKNSQRD